MYKQKLFHISSLITEDKAECRCCAASFYLFWFINLPLWLSRVLRWLWWLLVLSGLFYKRPCRRWFLRRLPAESRGRSTEKYSKFTFITHFGAMWQILAQFTGRVPKSFCGHQVKCNTAYYRIPSSIHSSLLHTILLRQINPIHDSRLHGTCGSKTRLSTLKGKKH